MLIRRWRNQVARGTEHVPLVLQHDTLDALLTLEGTEMLCPRCNGNFFTREYSTYDRVREVKCPHCNRRFDAPQRADVRRLIRELLADDLFSDDAYRSGDTVQRVQWMINKLTGEKP